MTLRGPDALVSRVLLPLARGGPLAVGAPIAVAEARRWMLEAEVLAPAEPGSPREALALARARVAADLVARPPHLALVADDVRIGVALHDALAAAHPRASEVTFARRVRTRIVAHALALAEAPPARGRAPVLARHTLLARLGELGRTDRLVHWWTGEAWFRGQPVPRRLAALPRLRRVREDAHVVSLAGLLLAEDGVPLGAITALYTSSPLTDLLDAGRGVPRFRWTPAVADLVADAELARAVLYRWLGATPTGERLAAAPAAAAGALLALPDRRSRSDATIARAAVPFLVHALLLVVVGHPGAGVPPAIEDALERLARRPHDGLEGLLALPVAAARVDPSLAAPPGLDPPLAARWGATCARIAVALGDDVLARHAHWLAAILAAP